MAMTNTTSIREIEAALASGYRAAIYCRLSKDDDQDGESASIANQRSMLESYCAKQGWEVVAVFQDNGYTGLNLDRPDFQRMLKAIEKGMVNLVITKDLSRLSRNYLESGRLIEEYFPRHGVRYIAMNDNVDTLRENNEIAPFKGILKNKCRLLVGNTFSPKFRQGYIFSHNQTNIPIEHLNILVALTVYNGTLTDFNMVNQFVNDGPV